MTTTLLEKYDALRAELEAQLTARHEPAPMPKTREECGECNADPIRPLRDTCAGCGSTYAEPCANQDPTSDESRRAIAEIAAAAHARLAKHTKCSTCNGDGVYLATSGAHGEYRACPRCGPKPVAEKPHTCINTGTTVDGRPVPPCEACRLPSKEPSTFAELAALAFNAKHAADKPATEVACPECVSSTTCVRCPKHTIEHATRVFEKPPLAPVPRGHCGRCDRCGWEFAKMAHGGCIPAGCSMRPLPDERTHCPGCGAPYETSEAGATASANAGETASLELSPSETVEVHVTVRSIRRVTPPACSVSVVHAGTRVTFIEADSAAVVDRVRADLPDARVHVLDLRTKRVQTFAPLSGAK